MRESTLTMEKVKWNADKLANRVTVASYLYRGDQDDGVQIHISPDSMPDALFREIVRNAEIGGFEVYQVIREKPHSLPMLKEQTKELISRYNVILTGEDKRVDNQSVIEASSQNMDELVNIMALIAGNVVTLLYCGEIEEDAYNGTSYTANGMPYAVAR